MTGAWPWGTPRPAWPPVTPPSTWPRPWSAECGCAHECACLGGGGDHRRRRVGAAVPGRPGGGLPGRAGLPGRHAGHQPVRRGDPRLPDRPGPRQGPGAAGRHGRGRLVHHVLDLDVRDRTAGRRPGTGPGRGQRGGQPGAGRGRGRAGAVDRGTAVITDGLKLTSYFGERQRAGGQFVADALAGLYGRNQVAASILLRGVEGFGLKHRLRTDLSLSLSEDLPLTAIAVDERERIEALTPEAVRLTGSGLITLERARLLTGDLDGEAVNGNGGAAKVTIYLGRQERVYRVPAFVAVCDLLYRRGVDGGGPAPRRGGGARFSSRNAEVPMMVIAVGAEDRIARVLPELGGLLARPLATVERVVVCKRDGQLRCPPPLGEPAPGPDGAPGARWQKLMVYTSEASRADGQPIHRAIVRRLRSAGLAGATTQLGIWGFHGAHPPHGDRLFQLSRHVPAVTSVINRPERIAVAFGLIDELTTATGLVTSENVPARFRPADDS